MGLPLAIAFAGLDWSDSRTVRDHRSRIAWAAEQGFRAVQLDATAIKPRDLDRSARRDLAATLRRHELTLAGLDLWIPANHFARSETLDRAASALVDAIDMAADLVDLVAESCRVVSIELPRDMDQIALGAILARADARSVSVADHAWPRPSDSDGAGVSPDLTSGPLMLGVDPAAMLLAGDDPSTIASRRAASIASARLSDLSSIGRVLPGNGRLDIFAYRIALETGGYRGPVVLDLRGVRGGADRAGDVRQRWGV